MPCARVDGQNNERRASHDKRLFVLSMSKRSKRPQPNTTATCFSCGKIDEMDDDGRDYDLYFCKTCSMTLWPADYDDPESA